MLNLLIISNSPKAKLIQAFMQPLIKSKIDVVPDFDFGLKDVFEKRPATVIIQELIAGVAGESVARHIQMLLGSSAPTFILMHEGNTRIRPVKGLFEVIVNLDQPDETMKEEVLSALKRVIGDQWDKVAVPSPKVTAVRVVSSTVPDEDRVAADKLVDDFFSDLGTSEERVPGQRAGQQAGRTESPVVSKPDELAGLLIDSLQDAEPLRSTDVADDSAAEAVKRAGGDKRPAKDKPPSTKKGATSPPSAVVPPTGTLVDAATVVSDEEPFEFPALDAVLPQFADAAVPAGGTPTARQAGARTEARSGTEAVVPAASPADFRISRTPEASQEQLPEDILMAFDENYRSRTRRWVVLLVSFAVLSCAAGGWYLFTTKHKSLVQWSTSSPAAPGAVTPVEAKKSSPTPALQNKLTSAAGPVSPVVSSLPSFVSAGGRDQSFSTNKPGWERYVDTTREVRIYRVAGRIRAMQVMAAKGQQIADSFMLSALREVAGSNVYTLRSREQKQGFVIQRCSIGPASDLLVYRKQPSDAISAFVVSLE